MVIFVVTCRLLLLLVLTCGKNSINLHKQPEVLYAVLKVYVRTAVGKHMVVHDVGGKRPEAMKYQ